MEQPVSTIMSDEVTTVQADDTVEAVATELRRHALSFVPVVEGPGGALLGIISIGDILQFEAAKRDPASVRAWEICTYKPVEVGPDTPLDEVARRMIERQIHHVIVTEDKTIKGVVSALDFVRQFVARP
jgi:CBS domain-containing protein